MTKTVKAVFSSGGNTLVTTSTTGSNYVTFPAQSCKQLTISNNSGTNIEIQQGGTGPTFPVYPFSYMTFSGLTDASNIGLRRVDNSNTQVVVNARWES